MISNLLYRSFFIDSWLIRCFLNCSVSLAQRTFKFSVYLPVFWLIFTISSSMYLLRKCALSAESCCASLTSFRIWPTLPSWPSLIAVTSFITFLSKFCTSYFVSLSLFMRWSTSMRIISLSLSVTWSWLPLNPSISYLTASLILETSARKTTSYWVLAISSCLIQPLMLLIYASKFELRD